MAVEDSGTLRDWLRLLGSGLKPATITSLSRHLQHPSQILEASDGELASGHGLDSADIARLRRQPSSRQVDNQLRLAERHGMKLLPLADPQYPRNLFHMRVPPPAIFVKGSLEDYDSLSIGIVGPRHATAYGLEVTTAFVRDMAPSFTIVSGAAIGIDSRAHDTALRHGGRTLAVLGCGIDVDYPAQNRRLRERIPAEGGALVSTFLPGTQPLRGNFPARNFILAGLSLAVVVTEASARSGALVTARAAGEEGRPVYAVPGDINRVNSAGSNALLRDGAIALSSVSDLIGDLEPLLAGELETLMERRRLGIGGDAAAGGGGDGISANQPATTQEVLLLEAIRHNSISHDDLLEKFVPDTMSLGDLSTALLMLEMDGRIHQRPGRIYTAAV
ncbi:MAG: DNA-processing protein DprA [Candidatus Sumerlaeia bacterium]|nr:DNA-processing protein DprA [Candidatus Sumerlaeia bacterium]